MMTVEQCLRLAMAALLRGDTETRDRYCRLAQNLTAMKGRHDSGEPLQPGPPIRLPDRSKAT